MLRMLRMDRMGGMYGMGWAGPFCAEHRNGSTMGQPTHLGQSLTTCTKSRTGAAKYAVATRGTCAAVASPSAAVTCRAATATMASPTTTAAAMGS
jgi:hypothetical protein